MKVLVCGGAGYIGSNMTAMLAAAGHKPVVFDNFSKGHRAAVRDADIIEGNLTDFELLVQTLKKNEIEAVMHFAAFIEVGESVQKPLQYYHNNFCATQNLLSAMEEAGVKKFIFSSSAAVYGIPQQVPITEMSLTQPINPYGWTKLMVEKMCHDQNKAGKLAYAALRYFNACGAGANATLGEDHHPESHLIPLIIKAALGTGSPVKIFGTDYPTLDGTCIRDYIHIDDLCRAHLLALNKLEQGSELIYNLGSQKGYSVREVIETVKKISGRDFKVIETDRRPGDPPVLLADASKATQQLGWKPQKDNLEEMISTAWLWHNKHPDGYID
jgi:UDP-glucose 4-epimerase